MRDLPCGWTIGVELEIADAERDRPLPGTSRWDRKDYTIVNSNGVANDPSGVAWRFGGEINTQPTDSIAAQAELIDATLAACRPAPQANYRCNFHVHLHVPGLATDVTAVQRVAAFSAAHASTAFVLVDPIPDVPPDLDACRRSAALVRRRRRLQSHHTVLADWQLAGIAAATTIEDVHVAHYRRDRHGRAMKHLMQRAGVNLTSLWLCPAATVEFRHFVMSLDVEELWHAMRWCAQYLAAALDDATSLPAVWAGSRFPRQPLYNHWQEVRYRATSRRYHSLAHVLAVLDQWQKDGRLYESVGVVHGQSVAQPAPGALF